MPIIYSRLPCLSVACVALCNLLNMRMLGTIVPRPRQAKSKPAPSPKLEPGEQREA